MQVVAYSQTWRKEWDETVSQSKNGTFLFQRSFMEYHKDRFVDASLLFLEKERVVGLLPATHHADERSVVSHGGLTYGGLVLPKSATVRQVTAMLQFAIRYYKETLQAACLRYRPVPAVYHCYPSEEDLYVLFRQKARLIERRLASVVKTAAPLPLQTLRRRGVKKAYEAGLTMQRAPGTSKTVAQFWTILSENLQQRHGVCPVHSLAEIRRLSAQFPDEILYYTVTAGTDVVGGCVVFRTPQVCHVQYIAADERGRKTGALDLLFTELIDKARREGTPYVDFGVSTECGGTVLNEGLLFQKEGFGARGICYDTYALDLTDN